MWQVLIIFFFRWPKSCESQQEVQESWLGQGPPLLQTELRQHQAARQEPRQEETTQDQVHRLSRKLFTLFARKWSIRWHVDHVDTKFSDIKHLIQVKFPLDKLSEVMQWVSKAGRAERFVSGAVRCYHWCEMASNVDPLKSEIPKSPFSSIIQFPELDVSVKSVRVLWRLCCPHSSV